jgi:prophage DNA circulation protein
MALAEVLRITNSVRDGVKVVDDKVERVEDKVEVIGDQVEDIGNQLQCVDGKVQVVIDGARGISSQSPILSNVYAFRQQGGKRGGERSKIDYSTVGKRHR